MVSFPWGHKIPTPPHKDNE